jgi:hypothetical protein
VDERIRDAVGVLGEYVDGEVDEREFALARQAVSAEVGVLEVDVFVDLCAALAWGGMRSVPVVWLRACYGALQRELSGDPSLCDYLLASFVARGVLGSMHGVVDLQHVGFRGVVRKFCGPDLQSSPFFRAWLDVVADGATLPDVYARVGLWVLWSLRCGRAGLVLAARIFLVARLCAAVEYPRAVRVRDLRVLSWLCLLGGGGAEFARDVLKVVGERVDVVGFLADAVLQFDVAPSAEVAVEVAMSVVQELGLLGVAVDLPAVSRWCGDLSEGARWRSGQVDAWGSFCGVICGAGAGVDAGVWVRVVEALVARGSRERARQVLAFVDPLSLDVSAARVLAAVRVVLSE